MLSVSSVADTPWGAAGFQETYTVLVSMHLQRMLALRSTGHQGTAQQDLGKSSS